MRDAILLLDDDQAFLDSMAEFVDYLFHRRCFAARSVAELVALGPAIRDAALAILDINLGPDAPSGLDAYAWLKRHHFAGRIIFLSGHGRSHPLVARALHLDGVQVFSKPVSAPLMAAILAGDPLPVEPR